MTTEKVFVREATGLVREFSLTDAWLFSLGSYVVMTILVWALFGMYAFPGYDWPLGFALASILSIAWGLTFGLFAAVMPRAGGDYTYVSRTISPAWGFANNFAFTMVGVIGFWGIAITVWIGMTFGLSSWLDIVGKMLANPSMAWWGGQMSGPVAFILGAVFVLIVIGINMVSRRVTSLLLKMVFVVSILTYIAPYVGFLTTSHEQYVVLFNDFASKYYGGVTYQGIIDLAKASGWSSGYSITNTFYALPVMFLGYYGFTLLTSAAGEVKRPDRNIVYAIILAVVTGLVISMGLWFTMKETVGYEFMGAASFLANTGTYPLPAYSVTPMGFSVPIYPDPATTSLTFLSYFVMNEFFFCVPVAIAASRNMFAWSFDRIAPQWLSNVSERFHTPVNALAVTAVLAIGFIAMFAFAPWLTVAYNTLGLVMFSQMIVGLAAAVFPYRCKDIFNAGPSIVRTRIVGVPLLTIAGIVTAISMGAAAVVNLQNPVISGPTGPEAFTLGIALYAIGFVWYYVAKWYRAKQGIDLSVVFRQIPPE